MSTMATVKKGILTPPPQWWKHLRDWKRIFWKKERQNSKEMIRREARFNSDKYAESQGWK